MDRGAWRGTVCSVAKMMIEETENITLSEVESLSRGLSDAVQ